MGKGDRKTRRGKIWMGTFGVRRKRKRKKAIFIPASQNIPFKSKPVTPPLAQEVPSPRFSAKDEVTASAEPLLPVMQPVTEATTVETPVMEQEIIEKAGTVKEETVTEPPAKQAEQVAGIETKKEKVSGKREGAKPAKKAPAKKPAAAKKTGAKTPAANAKETKKAAPAEEKKKRGRPRHTTGQAG